MAMDHKFLKETWLSPTAIEFHERGEIAAYREVMELEVWHCRIGMVRPKGTWTASGGQSWEN